MNTFFHHCPNCASVNHTFDNAHRFECSDCHFVYYHNVAAAVMVIIKSEDKFLFTKRNIEPEKGKLDFPGGFVDPGENADEAAVRELKEELNLDINKEDLVLKATEANDYFFRNIQYRTLDIVFETEIAANQTLRLEESEIQEVYWLSKEEIKMDDLGFKSMKKVVQKLILNG